MVQDPNDYGAPYLKKDYTDIPIEAVSLPDRIIQRIRNGWGNIQDLKGEISAKKRAQRWHGFCKMIRGLEYHVLNMKQITHRPCTLSPEEIEFEAIAYINQLGRIRSFFRYFKVRPSNQSEKAKEMLEAMNILRNKYVAHREMDSTNNKKHDPENIDHDYLEFALKRTQNKIDGYNISFGFNCKKDGYHHDFIQDHQLILEQVDFLLQQILKNINTA